MKKTYLIFALVSLFSLASCDGITSVSAGDSNQVSSETPTSVELTYKLTINTNQETYYANFSPNISLSENSIMEACYGDNADNYISLGVYSLSGSRIKNYKMTGDTTVYLNSITEEDYNTNYVLINVNDAQVPVKKNEALSYDYVWKYLYKYQVADDVARWAFYTDDLYINKYEDTAITETIDLYYAELLSCNCCNILAVSPELEIKKAITIADSETVDSYESVEELISDNFDGSLDNYTISGLYEDSNFSEVKDDIQLECGRAYLTYIDVDIISNN
ncbi:MAG: hypothetical protein WCR63_04995 [Bacilli bacterium]